MKILFVMEKRVNAGSIQAVANYMRAGNEFGHSIALYGRQDPNFPRLRFSTEASAFEDRKSTRLNSSHGYISYAVFCLKKKTGDYLMQCLAPDRSRLTP